MPKQQVTIEVDVPEGYEGFLRPLTEYDNCYALNWRPVWQWPAWLKAEWIAMDADGVWWAYENEPNVFDRATWYAGGSKFEIDPRAFDFTPPPSVDWKHGTDWRQSKRRRPS